MAPKPQPQHPQQFSINPGALKPGHACTQDVVTNSVHEHHHHASMGNGYQCVPFDLLVHKDQQVGGCIPSSMVSLPGRNQEGGFFSTLRDCLQKCQPDPEKVQEQFPGTDGPSNLTGMHANVADPTCVVTKDMVQDKVMTELQRTGGLSDPRLSLAELRDFEKRAVLPELHACSPDNSHDYRADWASPHSGCGASIEDIWGTPAKH
jgi:hypothetical protein